MDLDAAKEVVRRSYGVYASGDVGVLDEVVAQDYVDHNPVPGQGAGLIAISQLAAGKIIAEWGIADTGGG